MKTKHYTTEFLFTARIKAWILRRFGYRTRIDEQESQVNDLLCAWEYNLRAIKFSSDDKMRNAIRHRRMGIADSKIRFDVYQDALLIIWNRIGKIPKHMVLSRCEIQREMKRLNDVIKGIFGPNPWTRKDLEEMIE